MRSRIHVYGGRRPLLGMCGRVCRPLAVPEAERHAVQMTCCLSPRRSAYGDRLTGWPARSLCQIALVMASKALKDADEDSASGVSTVLLQVTRLTELG